MSKHILAGLITVMSYTLVLVTCATIKLRAEVDQLKANLIQYQEMPPPVHDPHLISEEEYDRLTEEYKHGR